MMTESGFNPNSGERDPTYAGHYGALVAHMRRIPFTMADGHVQALTLTETVRPVDRWGSYDPEWNSRIPTGRHNLLWAAEFAEKNIDEY
jgi:prepilin-type processing-associated H-X9-DG protein